MAARDLTVLLICIHELGLHGSTLVDPLLFISLKGVVMLARVGFECIGAIIPSTLELEIASDAAIPSYRMERTMKLAAERLPRFVY